MKIMDKNFELAEEVFQNGFYDKSFVMFKDIATNRKYNLEIRAEAYNMMGVIVVCCAPYLSEDDDDSGLSFFKKSLEVDPKNISAALNILNNYKNSPTSHHDTNMTKVACQSLKDWHWENISEKEKKFINSFSSKDPLI